MTLPELSIPTAALLTVEEVDSLTSGLEEGSEDWAATTVIE